MFCAVCGPLSLSTGAESRVRDRHHETETNIGAATSLASVAELR